MFGVLSLVSYILCPVLVLLLKFEDSERSGEVLTHIMIVAFAEYNE